MYGTQLVDALANSAGFSGLVDNSNMSRAYIKREMHEETFNMWGSTWRKDGAAKTVQVDSLKMQIFPTVLQFFKNSDASSLPFFSGLISLLLVFVFTVMKASACYNFPNNPALQHVFSPKNRSRFSISFAALPIGKLSTPTPR